MGKVILRAFEIYRAIYREHLRDIVDARASRKRGNDCTN
jgi:hypothetical protein